jgi:hypothetical protein
MRKFCFGSWNFLAFGFKSIVAFMLLSQCLAFAQTVQPPKQVPNLPLQISPAAVGQKPPAAAPGAAGPKNLVRTYTPRVGLTSEEWVLKGSVDSVQVSTTYYVGLGHPVQIVIRQESPQRLDVIQPIFLLFLTNAPGLM